jgi:hypothetical protein
MGIRLACLFGLTVFAGCESAPPRDQVAQSSLFDLLEQRGYRPNPGLAGIYAPGNLIQTQALDDRGQPRPLASPILFMWRADCLPDHNPRVSSFVLPDSAGRSGSVFSLDAGLSQLLLPAIKLDRSLLTDYRIELGEAEVHTLAKGDISQRFSPRCVNALARAIDDGDAVEWFAVIVEAVVVNSLNIEMSWQAGAGASARLSYLDRLQRQLATALTGKEAAEATGDIGLVNDNARQSVLRANGPVIIGYRARPLQPVYQ